MPLHNVANTMGAGQPQPDLAAIRAVDKHKSTLGALLDAALDEAAAAAAAEAAEGDSTGERRATAGEVAQMRESVGVGGASTRDAADAPERVQGAAGGGSSTFGGARCVRRPVAQPLDAFVCDGVLPASLCRRLVEQSEAMGYSFWHPGEGAADGAVSDFRSADTVEVTHKRLAAAIWESVQDAVVKEVVLTEEDERCERGMEGVWRACCINHDLLFARYTEGGHFSPHTDGYTIWDFNRRSFYSCLMYLNTCGGGGATRMLKSHGVGCAQPEFITDGGLLVEAVPAVEGSALMFSQNLPHEGEPVEPGAVKYLIRTDVMYERVHKVCDGEADRAAYALFREAELVEADGDSAMAAQMYRRCMRMSPPLAKALGL